MQHASLSPPLINVEFVISRIRSLFSRMDPGSRTRYTWILGIGQARIGVLGAARSDRKLSICWKLPIWQEWERNSAPGPATQTQGWRCRPAEEADSASNTLEFRKFAVLVRCLLEPRCIVCLAPRM